MKNTLYTSLFTLTLFVFCASFSSQAPLANDALHMIALQAFTSEMIEPQEQLPMIIDGVQVSFYTPQAKSTFFVIRARAAAKRQRIIAEYEEDNADCQEDESLAIRARFLKKQKASAGNNTQ